MRLIAPLLLLALSPALVSCQQQAIAQDGAQDGWEPGGEAADPATAGDRLVHRFALVDWSQVDLAYVGGADSFSQSRAICARHMGDEPPAADWPLLIDTAALQGCDSFALLYGLNGPADPVAARQCALVERETMGRELASNGYDSRPTLEGPGMLSLIYANGLGVRRNLGVAIHMACEMNGAPFEMEGRVTRLEDMRVNGWAGTNFTPCDDMTSGYGAGECSRFAARLAARDRDMAMDRLAAAWSPDQRSALADAREAFAAYSRIANALNCDGGTLAAACVSAGTNGLTDLYTGRLRAVIERHSIALLPAERPDGDFSIPSGPARAATMSDAEWQALLAEFSPEERPEYEDHRAATIAARQAFEPKLIAFLRLARPDLTAHQVRVLFRDL